MDRVILHADADSFYASVECLYRPEIREKPVAVCGDPEARHGIVLTANRIAKKTGLKVGMAIWQARQLCPQLVVVPPNYSLYIHFSRMLREIYYDFTNQVESFGLDECWLDITEPGLSVEQGQHIANKIRERVVRELGITVSVGVSFNKVFAKLGSDLHKPNGTTVITPAGFREVVWPLPVNDLLYVGPRTTEKLLKYGICTIGQLANAEVDLLKNKFGRNGIMLKGFALGLDTSRVMNVGHSAAIKSVGNSVTTPHDIETLEDAKCVYYMLAEAVSARMREEGFRTKCVSISARRTDLTGDGCQLKVPATSITSQIAETATRLFTERFVRLLPLRSVGLSCGALVAVSTPEQISFFDDTQRERLERLDTALDGLRDRFGHQVVQRGIVMYDKKFAALNPREDHLIHPAGYMMG